LLEHLKVEVGIESRSRERGSSVCQVVVNGVKWSKLFEALCSHGAGAKRLHPALSAGPSDFLENMLTSWMDGDRQQGMSAVTISRELAMNMFDIANHLGKMPILSTHTKEKVDKHGIHHKHAWKVGWGDKGRVNHGTEQDDTHLWRKVYGLESEPFEGFVFNFSVEGDNSYVAEGIGVHNCWANGVAGACETARVIQGLPHVRISPASAAIVVSGGTRGGYEGDAVHLAATQGWAPASLVPQHSTDRRLMSDPKVIASRKHFVLLDFIDCGDSFDKLGSGLLQNLPGLAAFPDWSHVTEIDDLLEVERNSFGCLGCNSWGDWGGKNSRGRPGYYVFRENSGPHCRPSGIFLIRQMTPHPGTEYLGAA
jgi:hypothetical protein